MFSFFEKKTKKEPNAAQPSVTKTPSSSKNTEQWAARKGELGEYKITIQLDQFPKNYKHISDLMIENTKSSTGYSQIDHVIITPYGLFVIETKNYQGTIYGGKDRKTWLVNGKFKMMSPLVQNYGHIQAIKNIVDSYRWFHSPNAVPLSLIRNCEKLLPMNWSFTISNSLNLLIAKSLS